MMIGDQLTEIEKSSKGGHVILMGDFNLELNKPQLWKRALAKASEYQIYQEALTTLSVPRNSLASY